MTLLCSFQPYLYRLVTPASPSDRSCAPRRFRPALIVLLPLLTLAACAAAPALPKAEPSGSAAAFEARRPDPISLGLPPIAAGWNPAQWYRLAQAGNAELAELRAQWSLTQAGTLTAAQRPNPTLNLSGEYLSAAAGMPAWLFGVALDFLLQNAGSRDRAQAIAWLQTDIASAALVEQLWQLRITTRSALLDAVAAGDEARLLAGIVEQRSRLLDSERLRLVAGASAAGEVLRAEAELSAAGQRQWQADQRVLAARQRLAATVGLPLAAIADAPLQWPDWDRPDRLAADAVRPDRDAALQARPQLLQALREIDIAELALQAEVAKRWPDLRLSPGYTWDHGQRKLQLGVGLSLPLFNRNEGPIAEALARRELAVRHLETVQTSLYAQLDSAERSWPAARERWRLAVADYQRLARLVAIERRRLAAGESDQPALLTAEIAAAEALLQQQNAALQAQREFAALEDACRTPFDAAEAPAVVSR